MKTYLLPILVLLVAGCRNQRQQQAIFADKLDSVKRAYTIALDSMRLEYANTTDSLIRIRYTNHINGYRVNVMWQPEYVGYSGKIIGKAIINFRKQGTYFSMVHSHYFLNGELGIAKGSDTIRFDKSHIYEIEYPAQSMREDVPFFFEDHGHKLVFTMWHEGQRHTNAYRYYNVGIDGCIQDDLYQITFQEPYTRIDDLSSFDGDKITIRTHGGAYHQTEEIYQMEYSTDSYKLKQIKERIEDSVFIYKIEKQLVKTEYINRD